MSTPNYEHEFASVVEKRSKWRRRRRRTRRTGGGSGWNETTCSQEICEAQGGNQVEASKGARRSPWRRGEETFRVDERQASRSFERSKRKGGFFQAQRWDGLGISFGRAGSNHPSIRGYRFRLCSARETEYRFESGSTSPCAALAVAEGEKKDTKRGKEKAKEVERKKKKKRKHREEPLEDELKMVASNVTTSGSLRTQLVRRAVLNEKMTLKEKKKRRGMKDAAKKLREALTDVLSPKESKRKREKEKKKKKRKRLADGVIESCSSTCSSSSVEEEEDPSSTSEDLETPMKKRSRDKPGSVLKMLTQHVQEQLEQAAATELESSQNSLTGGVKIQTYFALQIRPSFQSSLREMREMHHLSHVMDALRRGEIAKVGDALAARFMAIHQSLLDQNWATAKFMEIFPLEEASAASSSMVLATRKHTKMVAKMQGFTGGGGWYGPPRKGGKGGKGQWYNYGDQKGEGKDSKGKGKKGKGRGRGKNDWTATPNEWKDTKDKPEEK